MFSSSDSQREEEDIQTFQNQNQIKEEKKKQELEKIQNKVPEKDIFSNAPQVDQSTIERYQKMDLEEICCVKLKINPENQKLEVDSIEKEENLENLSEKQPCYVILNFKFIHKEKEKKRFIFLAWLPEQVEDVKWKEYYEKHHFDLLKTIDKLMIKMVARKKEDLKINSILKVCLVWEQNFYSFFDEEI
jgi:hypothetical protein